MLIRTISPKKITTAAVSSAFVTYWVFVYETAINMLSDNRRQLLSKFFMSVCSILGIRNLFTTTYHPQTNSQVERFNCTILDALLHYVGEHPKDWDISTDSITRTIRKSTERLL